MTFKTKDPSKALVSIIEKQKQGTDKKGTIKARVSLHDIYIYCKEL